MIHCIGDSHASFFSGQNAMQDPWPSLANDTLSYFRSYRIGPATAYQLNSKFPILLDIIYKQVAESDSILMCFGEVDCRVHLPKHNNIEECVNRYFSVVKCIQAHRSRVMVWGPHYSQTICGSTYNGTFLERKQIVKEFNNLLKVLCNQNDIPFITLADDILDELGVPNIKYYATYFENDIHLSQNAMPIALNKFREKGII